MSIWLETNQKAHDFIASDYWSSHYEMVKEMLPRAEVYVFETDEKNVRAAGRYTKRRLRISENILSADWPDFIGITGGYIAGIIVKEGEQSREWESSCLTMQRRAEGNSHCRSMKKMTVPYIFISGRDFV